MNFPIARILCDALGASANSESKRAGFESTGRKLDDL